MTTEPMHFGFGFPFIKQPTDEQKYKRKRLQDESYDLDNELALLKIQKEIKIKREELIQLRDELNQNVCVKCRKSSENEQAFALIPCGHVDYCGECAKKITLCGCGVVKTGVLALQGSIC